MTNQDRLPLAERAHEANHVSDQLQDVVRIDVLGRVGTSEAPHIGNDHAIARSREHWRLMTPGISELWPTMTENDQRSLTLLCQVHPDAVGSDEVFPDVCGHNRLPTHAVVPGPPRKRHG